MTAEAVYRMVAKIRAPHFIRAMEENTMSAEMIKRLKNMDPKARNAMRHRLLELFRKAEGRKVATRYDRPKFKVIDGGRPS